MEENIPEVITEMHYCLSMLMSCEDVGPPPLRLKDLHPQAVLIGKAMHEQRAIAVLYNEVQDAHEKMHEASGIPMGVHPDVSFDHYRCHVLRPILFELLKWSAHRAYPEQKTNLAIRFDDEWNMYAELKPLQDTKEDSPLP
ncbi:MAG: hypothetical protein V4644_02650 [Patescibacteria group bacterium]